MYKVYAAYHGTNEIEHILCACTVDNPLAKARDYLSVQAHKPCSTSHLASADVCCITICLFFGSQFARFMLRVFVCYERVNVKFYLAKKVFQKLEMSCYQIFIAMCWHQMTENSFKRCFFNVLASAKFSTEIERRKESCTSK